MIIVPNQNRRQPRRILYSGLNRPSYKHYFIDSKLAVSCGPRGSRNGSSMDGHQLNEKLVDFFVHQTIRLNPRHHAAQALANLFDRMLRGDAAQGLDAGRTGTIF